MSKDITLTNEKYGCSNSLNAFVVTFPSLQCDMTACSGDKNNLEKFCESCGNYIINVRKKDWEKIDKPL